MATINEFLPFADQSTANLIPYAEWVNAAKRLTGFVSGIAKSNEMNRVFAQGAQAGYAIAKFIERTLSEDVYVADGERLADQFYRAIVQMSYRATPIGCILTFPVHVEIDGYVATNNGGNLSQTTYDQLYAVYGTKFNTSSTLANQFGIPDMAHRVFEAAATLEEIGCYIAAGLPNSKGVLPYLVSTNSNETQNLGAGALQWQKQTSEQCGHVLSDSKTGFLFNPKIDLSLGNSIYSDSIFKPSVDGLFALCLIRSH